MTRTFGRRTHSSPIARGSVSGKSTENRGRVQRAGGRGREGRGHPSSARAGTRLASRDIHSSVEARMFRLFAHNWLNRRLARVVPNPYVRAAAVAGTGLLITRLLQSRGTRRR